MTVSGKPFKVARLNVMEGRRGDADGGDDTQDQAGHGRDEKSIGQISKDFNLSRNTLHKELRSDATRFEYHRTVQPIPRMEGFTDWIVEQLGHASLQPKKYRRTAKVLYEQLKERGYEGGYDAVRRFMRRWREEAGLKAPNACVPLEFAPGQAYPFD